MLYNQQGQAAEVKEHFKNDREREYLLGPLHEKLDNHCHNHTLPQKGSKLFRLDERAKHV